RLPFLVKGELRLPRPTCRAELVSGAPLKDLQFVKEPVLDRETLRPNGEHQYVVMPKIDPLELIETDGEAIAGELAPLPLDEALEYAGRVGALLAPGEALHLRF